jgi:hypothetical protein
MVNATTPAPAVRAAAPITSQNTFSKLFTKRLPKVWATLGVSPYAEITVLSALCHRPLPSSPVGAAPG